MEFSSDGSSASFSLSSLLILSRLALAHRPGTTAVQLDDKLPNTGWEQIETEWGVCMLGERDSDGGRPEVEHAEALICNSNEGC